MGMILFCRGQVAMSVDSLGCPSWGGIVLLASSK